MSLFGKLNFKGLFGRRGPAIPEPEVSAKPNEARGLTPAEREFVRLRADRLSADGKRSGNRRLIAQAKAIRERI